VRIIMSSSSFLTLRVHFNYEADLAGGKAGQYASELDPTLHVFATHGLGVLRPDSPSDGIVVVPTSVLAAQTTAGQAIVIDVPLNPAAVQYVRVAEDRLWALPGARSTQPVELPRNLRQWTVPADASLAFYAYAQTSTQHGQACRTRAGEAMFLLSELLDTTGREGWHRDQGGDVRAEWQTTGDEPLVKGFVVVQKVELLVHNDHHAVAGTMVTAAPLLVYPSLVTILKNAAGFHVTEQSVRAAKELLQTPARTLTSQAWTVLLPGNTTLQRALVLRGRYEPEDLLPVSGSTQPRTFTDMDGDVVTIANGRTKERRLVVINNVHRIAAELNVLMVSGPLSRGSYAVYELVPYKLVPPNVRIEPPPEYQTGPYPAEPRTVLAFAPASALSSSPVIKGSSEPGAVLVTDVFHGDDRNPVKAQQAVATAQWLAQQVDESLAVFFPSESAPLGRAKPEYMAHMHCPYYNTTAGLLWGSTYALRVPRAPPPAGYFTAALRAALLRNDAEAGHLLAAAKAQQAAPGKLLPGYTAVLATWASTLTVFANAMVYLDDFTNQGGRTYLARPDAGADHPGPDAAKRSHTGRVRLLRRNDVIRQTGAGDGGRGNDAGRLLPRAHVIDIGEDYKIARLGQGDDCEGVAKEIYVQYWEFRRANFGDDGPEQAHATADELALLQHMQTHISRSNVYTPMMVLAGVTNKKLDTTVQRDMSVDEAMAHTYTALVPTGLLLDRLQDASDTDPRFAGDSEAIRGSKYATEFRQRQQGWHAGTSVLVCEGTARSSPLTQPTTAYYATAQEKAQAARAAAVRYNAQVRLMQDLPLDVVGLEILNRRIDDADGRIARDLDDASDFYKGNSAAYVSAFRDAGRLDLGFAMDDGNGGLTHGLHFNRFIASSWHPSVRLVPYNRLTAEHGAVADEVLAQLEPIPALRRDPAAAAAAKVPAELRAIEHLFPAATAAPASTASLLTNATAMPLPPSTIVLSIRAEDLTDKTAASIVQAITKHRTLFTSATVAVHYLSDAPVPGDEASLPPVVQYDVSLRVNPAGDQ